MDFLVNYKEIYHGQIYIKADSREDANNKFLSMIDRKEIVPSEIGEHEITIQLKEN